MRNRSRRSRTGAVRTQAWPQDWYRKLWTGAICAVFRADAEPDQEADQWARPRPFVWGSLG
eukprot:1232406-Alexandrium_andersonii.AAC.1